MSVASLALICLGLVACSQKEQKHPDLTDARIRQLATEYRDAWLATNKPPQMEALSRGQIGVVTKTPKGWTVSFHTNLPTLPSEIHIIMLDVYIKDDGKLDRVEYVGEMIS